MVLLVWTRPGPSLGSYSSARSDLSGHSDLFGRLARRVRAPRGVSAAHPPGQRRPRVVAAGWALQAGMAAQLGMRLSISLASVQCTIEGCLLAPWGRRAAGATPALPDPTPAVSRQPGQDGWRVVGEEPGVTALLTPPAPRRQSARVLAIASAAAASRSPSSRPRPADGLTWPLCGRDDQLLVGDARSPPPDEFVAGDVQDVPLTRLQGGGRYGQLNGPP